MRHLLVNLAKYIYHLALTSVLNNIFNNCPIFKIAGIIIPQINR